MKRLVAIAFVALAGSIMGMGMVKAPSASVTVSPSSSCALASESPPKRHHQKACERSTR